MLLNGRVKYDMIDLPSVNYYPSAPPTYIRPTIGGRLLVGLENLNVLLWCFCLNALSEPEES